MSLSTLPFPFAAMSCLNWKRRKQPRPHSPRILILVRSSTCESIDSIKSDKKFWMNLSCSSQGRSSAEKDFAGSAPRKASAQQPICRKSLRSMLPPGGGDRANTSKVIVPESAGRESDERHRRKSTEEREKSRSLRYAARRAKLRRGRETRAAPV